MTHRHTSDGFERGFDEETGRTINANTCPDCAGPVRTDGGQIECRLCGLVLNEYARTGRLPAGSASNRRRRTSCEETV